jgi:nucleoside-diphosphate-sugar epimerase
MKKVLIIGYGDIGQRISMLLPEHQIIGVSRNNNIQNNNTTWHQWDWFSGKPLELPSSDISTVIAILKPTSFDEKGYQTGYLKATEIIMQNLNQCLDYQKLVVVSSTRVYGDQNGRDITEAAVPQADDFRGHIILEYEKMMRDQSKVNPLILRPSGLYDPKQKWMQKFINSFEDKQYSLASKESNRFDRNILAKIISNYIVQKKLAELSGIFICSEPPKLFSELFTEQYPEKNFEDFFIASNHFGKSFNFQKLIASNLMG